MQQHTENNESGSRRLRELSPTGNSTRQWAKRTFGAYNSDSSTTTTPQKKYPLVTLPPGSESDCEEIPRQKSEITKKDTRQRLSFAKELPFRALRGDFSTDSDVESVGETTDDQLLMLRKKISFQSQHYANTVCCSRGYKKLMGTTEAVQLLLSIDTLDPIATAVPFMPQDNCMFVIDLKQLKSRKDILSDHLGSWKANRGGKRYWFKRTGSPMKYAKTNREDEDDDTEIIKYEFQRTLYHHSMHRDYCRLIVQSDNYEYALVQYAFEDECHEIEASPHGNRRHGDQQYSRTFDSVKNSIKSADRKSGMNQLKTQRRHLEEFQHPDELIRGAKQVRNLTQNQQLKEDIWEIICKSKLEKEHPAAHFIRDIAVTPELVIFLASERQLDDMVKFCTNSTNFCVLGVDTLFNAGNFLVTVITYRNLLLKSIRSYSGLHPVMIGAVMLHVAKSEEVYSFVPFLLKKHRPALQNLRAVGSDEDAALMNALKGGFPDAAQFLCDLHLKDTVKRKLRELNVEHNCSTAIVKDIFGSCDGETIVGGLVNCSSNEYDSELEGVLDKWEYMSEGAEKFANYFRKYKSQQIKQCALLENRIASGMGLNVYTQNANECSNNVLKQALNYEKVTANEFIEVTRDVCTKQEKEVELAGMSRSERWFLLDEYKHLRIRDPDLYNTAVNPTSSDRAKTMRTIHRAKLLPKKNLSSEAATEDDTRKNVTNAPTEKETYVRDFLSNVLPAFNGLTNDLQAALIPKALLILRNKGELITNFPGKSADSAAMVASKSAAQPNAIEFDRTTGKISCTCSGYQLRKLCAHSLAVAADRDMVVVYKNWFNAHVEKRIDKVVRHGVSSKAGAKPSGTSRRKAPSKEFNPVKSIITNSSTYRAVSAVNVTTEINSTFSDTREYGHALPAPNESHSVNTSPETSFVIAEKPKQIKVQPDPYTCELHFLHDCNKGTRTCAGCHKTLHVSGKIGPPPEDIVVVSKFPRKFKRDGQLVVGPMGNAYFHINFSCLQREIDDFDATTLIIAPAVREKLFTVHYRHLKKVFGMQFEA